MNISETADSQQMATDLRLFRLGGQLYGLPAGLVVGETTVQPVHSIPRRSNRLLRGLVSHEGQLQLCVAVHALLGRELLRAPDDRQLLFIDGGGGWAFEVDAVEGVAAPSLGEPVTDPSRPLLEHEIECRGETLAVLDPGRLEAALERLVRAAQGDEQAPS